MFALKKKKNSIEKISEECRKYFNRDKETEIENIIGKVEIENSDENKLEINNYEIKENEEIKNTICEEEKRTRYVNFDEYFIEAARFVIESKRAAAGQLQRRFSIGFNTIK